MVGLLEQEEVLEGILACNWPFAEFLLHWRSDLRNETVLLSKHEQRLRTFAVYLQRLCGKCDTNGAYGPLFWGRLDAHVDDIWQVEPQMAGPSIGSRIVTVPYWVADAARNRLLLESMPLNHLQPRRHPLAISTPKGLVRIELLDGEPSRIGPMTMRAEDERAFNLADGENTVENIAVAVDMPASLVGEISSRLASEGWVRIGPEIPVGLADPLQWVEERVAAQVPEPAKAQALSAIGSLRNYAAQYATAGLIERLKVLHGASRSVAEALGVESMRGSGDFYVDRYVLHEDASLGWRRFALGKPVVDIIALELLLGLKALMTVPSRRWVARHRLFAEWFAETFQGRQARLPEFCEAVLGSPQRVNDIFDRAEAEAQQQARDLFSVLVGDAHVDVVEVRIDAARLEEYVRARSIVPCCVQPDVMFLVEESGPTVVLSDVHATQDLLVNGQWIRVHPDPETLVAAVWAGYRRTFPVLIGVPVLEHTDQTFTSLQLPTLHVEFAGRARAGGGKRLMAGDLWVDGIDGSLRLTTPDGQPILLTRVPVWYAGARRSPLSLFAPPLAIRLEEDIWPLDARPEYVPRVRVGSTILWRRTWVLPTAAVPLSNKQELFKQFLDEWRREHEAPELLFARVSGEKKPVLIDLENPFLVDWLRRRIKGTAASCQLTEMYPSPSQLWLRDARGGYCAEFRMSFFLNGRQEWR